MVIFSQLRFERALLKQ